MKKEARISGDCPLDGRPAGRNAPCTTESNRIHDLLTKKTALEESMGDVYSSLVYAFFLSFYILALLHLPFCPIFKKRYKLRSTPAKRKGVGSRLDVSKMILSRSTGQKNRGGQTCFIPPSQRK